MSAHGFALFDTAIGRCGIAWGPRGVLGVQLPERREPETRARMQRRFPDAREDTPPPRVRRVLDGIVALLRGEKRDLSAATLDMERVPPFHRRVYQEARTIPPGETRSYGQVAARLGEPGSARAVGQALGRNPFPIVVPCHRVTAAGGRIGGFSAVGGAATKLRILAIEGAHAARTSPLFEGDGEFGFDPATAVRHLRKADPGLARLMDTVGPFRMRLKRAPSLFAALAEAIVYQQLHPKAAATIFARVCAIGACGTGGPTAEQILRASDADLREAGLSRAKLAALRDLAQKTRDRTIPTLAALQGMDDDAILASLTSVRGVGRWTAEMLLMFRLGRPDVLPADDYGLRRGYAIAFHKRALPTREDLEKRGALWKPYRTVASWYLWSAAEL
jgi:methylated-DNA-[protein]-cysteine S-methyltransferase